MGNRKSMTRLTESHILMLTKITTFSLNDIRQWHQGFLVECPDGRLNKEKFTNIYTHFCPRQGIDKFCKYAFDTFGNTKDEKINLRQFFASLAVTNAGPLDERLAVIFDAYDVSNDAYVDIRQWANIISDIYGLAGVTDRSGNRDPKTRVAAMIESFNLKDEINLYQEDFVNACKIDPIIPKILDSNA